jgi:hypothetical protein
MIEATIIWNDVVINPEKFEKNANPNYLHAQFDLRDVQESTSTDAIPKKIDKYGSINKEANE